MPANIGRKLLIKRGSTVIAGVRTKSLTTTGDPVDITTDDDSGYRTFLAEAGQRALDTTVEGLTKDSELRSTALTGTSLLLTDVNIEFPNGDTITGDFFFNNFEEAGEYNNAVTFSASFQSSGQWTYTPAA